MPKFARFRLDPAPPLPPVSPAEPPAVWPAALQGINSLPDGQKLAIYRTLLPEWLFHDFGIDPETLTVEGERVVRFRCPPGSPGVEIDARHRPGAEDPLFYLLLADTPNHQVMVLLVVVNDPASPRFNIDVTEDGRPTQLGTAGRNIPEELRAMAYGLAPGQVRRGLRVMGQSLSRFEAFVARMGHALYLIEPLAYHNAVNFERYGFNYLRGRSDMIEIDRAFRPGGALHAKLDGSTPFRRSDVWKTIRGRSWAIQDGILGRRFGELGVEMYKRVGERAGVNTFPGAVW